MNVSPSGVVVVCAALVLGGEWLTRRVRRPSLGPNRLQYADRFGVEFGQLSRAQVEAAMRGQEVRQAVP